MIILELPKPMNLRVKTRLALVFGDGPSKCFLVGTNYTLDELNAAFNAAFDPETDTQVLSFWALPSAPNDPIEQYGIPVSRIEFWAISQVSDLVIAGASDMPAAPKVGP